MNRQGAEFVSAVSIRLPTSIHDLPSSIHKQIETQIVSDYNITDPRLPSGLCRPCRSKLHPVAEGQQQNSFNLDHINSLVENTRRRSPRKECEQCDAKCLVCSIAKANGQAAKKIHFKLQKAKGRPSIGPKPVIHNLCGKCLSPRYRECSHVCSNDTLLHNLLHSLPNNIQERYHHHHQHIFISSTQIGVNYNTFFNKGP